MRKWFKQLDLSSRLLVIALAITLSVAVILACFAPLSPWLALGWLYGTSGILVSFGLRINFLKQSLKRHFSKWVSGIVGALSLYLSLVWIGALFVILIVVNNVYFQQAPFSLSLFALSNGPLNFFTFLAGLSILLMTIVLGYGLASKRA